MPCCSNSVNDRERTRRFFSKRLPELNRSLPRMTDVVIKMWMESNRPIYIAGDTVSFRAPVGNTSYFNKERPAKIIISGFCVAGEAGLKYVKSSLLSTDSEQNIEAAHTFDTPTMIRGMARLIEDHNIHKTFNLSNGMDTLASAIKGEIPLMLTQALCPIIASGSSKASDVWRELRIDPSLRSFAGGCLNWWWKHVNTFSDSETKLFLMGERQRGRAELSKLLAFSRLDNAIVEITGADQKQYSVLKELKNRFQGRIYCTKHAAWYGRN